MKFDKSNKETYNYVDEYNLILCKNPISHKNEPTSIMDCIERTFKGYVAWENDEDYINDGKYEAVNAVKKCFTKVYKPNGKSYIQGHRHPSFIGDEYNDMSRDHTIYALAFMKYINDPFLNEMIDKLRFKISDKFSMTIDMWLWMKALNGGTLSRILFYIVQIPIMLITILINKLAHKMGGFGEELHQDDWEYISYQERLKNKRGMFWRSFIFHTFALKIMVTQLYVLPDSLLKSVLQKLLLWDTPKHNYLIQMMLGKKINSDVIYGYKAMTSDRWSGILNGINDRYLVIMTDPKFKESNVIDVDMLRAIYEKNK